MKGHFFCKYTFYNRLQIASQTIQFYHIPKSLPIILTVHNLLVYHNIKTKILDIHRYD